MLHTSPWKVLGTGVFLGLLLLHFATPLRADVNLALTLVLSPAEVSYGEPAFLSWQAPEGARCVASGAWAGQKSHRGEERVNDVRRHETFYLSCTKNGATVKRRVMVRIKEPVKCA